MHCFGRAFAENITGLRQGCKAQRLPVKPGLSGCQVFVIFQLRNNSASDFECYYALPCSIAAAAAAGVCAGCSPGCSAPNSFCCLLGSSQALVGNGAEMGPFSAGFSQQVL